MTIGRLARNMASNALRATEAATDESIDGNLNGDFAWTVAACMGR
jgi:hypothetical protein